jgi:hypothetical protein
MRRPGIVPVGNAHETQDGGRVPPYFTVDARGLGVTVSEDARAQWQHVHTPAMQASCHLVVILEKAGWLDFERIVAPLCLRGLGVTTSGDARAMAACTVLRGLLIISSLS